MTLERGAWLCLALVVALCGVPARAASCSRGPPALSATYDLHALALSGGNSYRVAAERHNFSYVFNLCGAVLDVPPGCPLNSHGGNAPAYQVAMDTGHCVRLGDGLDSRDVVWAPIDPEDEMAGVRYSFLHGDKCHSGQYRELHINVHCAPDVVGSAAFEHQRVSEDSCIYSLNIYSLYGCPRECPIDERFRVCSGHGFCERDRTHDMLRCFCNDGFEGRDCSQRSSDRSVFGLVDVVLVVLIVALTALLMGALMLYLKTRGLRKPRMFVSLTGAVEDDQDLVDMERAAERRVGLMSRIASKKQDYSRVLGSVSTTTSSATATAAAATDVDDESSGAEDKGRAMFTIE